ncbi:unnamed protein product, partial [marine sediment metagenome]
MSSDEREDVVALFQEGRLIASGLTTIVLPESGSYGVTIRVPDLRYIEFVVHYEFLTDPTTDPGTPVNRGIRGNVVGFTLVGVGRGTTLTAMVLCVG